jgi:site-specific DNA recombinase
MTACAIYTRKSTEEGLEQDFNSLHAQREACEAYVVSQKAMGWKALPAHYDDGGFSGGNMDRPALKRLLQDIEAGRVQTIVVYKVDRLTRSLADFAKLVERFDARGVSFVSVTQQFNTTTSMGRLTLNVLLSFAQFEREVTGERIRDKIAASKKKGMWMGGSTPIGYRVENKQLVPDEPEAERVREIFRQYLRLKQVSSLKEHLDANGWKTPTRATQRQDATGNRPFTRGHLYRILSSPVYVGMVPHNGQAYEGKHPAIVDEVTWDKVQRQLRENLQGHRMGKNTKNNSLLAGLVFDRQGHKAITSHANKGKRRYRYYVIQGEVSLRLPAEELEQVVIHALKEFLSSERQVLRALGEQTVGVTTWALSRAKELAQTLDTDPPTVKETIGWVLKRANVLEQAIELTADLGPLLPGVEKAPTHVVQVPYARKKMGMAVRLVVPGAAPRSRAPDQRMVALMLKAYGYFGRLLADEEPGVDAIARSEGVTGSHVTRVLQLAFLAPEVVEQISQGLSPATLGADRLLGAVPLATDWRHHWRSLTFA